MAIRSAGLAFGPEEGHEPCGARGSIRLFCDIAAEDEAEFKYAPELALVRSFRAKDISLRGVECIHPREIAAKVHASFLVGWRRSDRGACAARSKTQHVERSVGCSPRTREIFPAHRKRETALECIADIERPASCRRALEYADLLNYRHVAVLKVRLHDPGAFGVRIDHHVHLAIVLGRCGCCLIDGLPEIPHPVVDQTMGSLGKGY